MLNWSTLQAEKSIINVGSSTGIIFVFLVLYSGFTANPLETSLGLAILYLILRSFWKQNLPFILCYCLIYQWIEIFASIVEANYYNQDLNECFPDTGRLVAWLSLTGLSCVTAGLYLSVSKRGKTLLLQDLFYEAQKINIPALYILYGISFGLNIFLLGIAYISPSLTQALTHLANIKICMYLLLSYVFFQRKKGIIIYIFITLLEFISGLYSYFSSFKLVFIVIAISYISTIKHLSFKRFLTLFPALLIAIFILFTWQVVKQDYRKYLNQGARQQSINVSFIDAISNIYTLSTSSTSEDYSASVKGTFRRVGYLQYFALTLQRVPAFLPYENGKLFLSNINFAFVPRFINPNKGTKDDSKKTSKYTGRQFAGLNEGASFSLGYYTEFYIDFGAPGMFIALFIFAFLVGKIFNRIMRLPYNLLLRYSIAAMVLLPFAIFESDSIFLFGILFWGALTHIFVFKIIYRRIDKFITK